MLDRAPTYEPTVRDRIGWYVVSAALYVFTSKAYRARLKWLITEGMVREATRRAPATRAYVPGGRHGG